LGKRNSQWIFLLLYDRKKEVMELGGIRRSGSEKLFLVSTTHGGETCSIAAALATMDEFQNHDVIGHNQRLGQKFIDGSKEVIASHGLSNSIKKFTVQLACIAWLFRSRQETTHLDFEHLFHQEMIVKGRFVSRDFLSALFTYRRGSKSHSFRDE
jgi:glutamate-1-semialdehyde 2,1-aminomutase